ncbi:MAG TPA: SAM-dependent methyltransferase [Candidatus Nanopelagicales bacterium]|nr:SAM-dependent methyltransferase [Candidatus Nanopelagicales bacterium]
MPVAWDEARADVRALLLDTASLVRAVGAGKRRGVPLEWRRVELRPVALKGGVRLQVTAYDERQAHTSNHDSASAGAAVDALLDQGFGNWHVETADEVVQVRITKKGDAFVHRAPRSAPAPSIAAHDRVKARLLDAEHPDVRAFLQAVGVADGDGRIKPSKQDKHRQVEEFVRLLASSLEDARTAGALHEPTPENPWRVVDLGCGHAYLTVGAYVWLARVQGLPVLVHGVDVREQFRDRNAELASRLGWADELTFEAATIADADGEPAPDVVVALHACDTATDDALARAVRWGSSVVLAAPCCHHDLQAQVARSQVPSPYSLVARFGLLRERFLDVLTDTFRASLLRIVGYRVDVVEFVSDEHTNRNLMLRAVRTGARPSREDLADYDRLAAEWDVVPALATRIAPELERARA